MQPYTWTINDRVWGQHVSVTARTGQRVEIMFHNMSMMGHPMHLHGHAFQVVGIGNRRLTGAVRDTVYVPPMAALTIALDAGEAARWTCLDFSLATDCLHVTEAHRPSRGQRSAAIENATATRATHAASGPNRVRPAAKVASRYMAANATARYIAPVST